MNNLLINSQLKNLSSIYVFTFPVIVWIELLVTGWNSIPLLGRNVQRGFLPLKCGATVVAVTQQKSQCLYNSSCVLFVWCLLALVTSKCAQRDLDSARFLDHTLVFGIFALRHLTEKHNVLQSARQCMVVSAQFSRGQTEFIRQGWWCTNSNSKFKFRTILELSKI